MDDVLIRTEILPTWLDQKYFRGANYASIDDLISIIEDLDADIERLQEEYEDFKQDVEDNYRPIQYAEQVGISDRDFMGVR